MPTTLIEGQVIGGLQAGYPRYFRIYRSRTTIRRRKPSGAIALLSNPTAYSASKWKSFTSPDYTVEGELRTPAMGSRTATESLFNSSIFARVESMSVERLKQEMKDVKWSLGTFLGELPKTQAYLSQAIRRICGLYLSVRKRVRNWKHAKRDLKRLARKGKRYLRRRGLGGTFSKGAKDVSQLWLEWRYAVSPLVYDMDDMLQYLHSSASRTLINRSSKGASDNECNIFKSRRSYPPFMDSITVQGRATVYYRIHPNAAALKRLDLINLGATLWELTPLSFVVDMVLPVGDFIGNLDAMAGVSVLGGTYSKRSSVETVRPDWRSFSGATSGGSSSTGEFYQRRRWSPTIAMPAFTTSPTGKQLVDLCALMRTMIFK